MAKWTIRFFIEASDELEEAEQWYRARDEKVADNWRKEVRAKIRSIAQHPELWAVDRSGIREVRVGDYKHKVVYRLHGNAIEIVAIAHTSRNPRYWKRRLKKKR
jgi:plasmid stabilization system protein ParE